MSAAAAWSIALGVDLAFGEPPARLHPVVGMGRLVGGLERLAPADPARATSFGVLLALAPATFAALAGVAIGRLRPGPLRALATAWTLKSSFALRALLAAGRRVERALLADDLATARRECVALVSRPTSDLSAQGIASAAIESLAENLCDSYVAPLVFYRVAGLPGALAYRAVNTADAMVGYHGRYEHVGKAAARLDDLLNLLPARLSAAALVAGAAITRDAATRAGRVAVREHARAASPNAGWPMAAAAGALGVRLAKGGHYAFGGDRDPRPADIARARRLVAVAAALVTVGVLASYRWVRS